MAQAKGNSEILSPAQQAIIPIAAFTAKGDIKKLAEFLNAELDNGLRVNDIVEKPQYQRAANTANNGERQ